VKKYSFGAVFFIQRIYLLYNFPADFGGHSKLPNDFVQQVNPPDLMTIERAPSCQIRRILYSR
jgi:hypothetical protein